MNDLTICLDENIRVLEELRELVARLNRDQYATTGGLPVASGPGGHVRHILDAYDCFLRGLESGRVDFTSRERDSRTAAEPEVACERIDRTARALAGIRGTAATPLAVRAEDSGASGWFPSSVGRELQSLVSHTIHHLALVALVLRLRGVEPGSAVGVAPSTLAYWRRAS